MNDGAGEETVHVAESAEDSSWNADFESHIASSGTQNVDDLQLEEQ
jgi:hypothetical protein